MLLAQDTTAPKTCFIEDSQQPKTKTKSQDAKSQDAKSQDAKSQDAKSQDAKILACLEDLKKQKKFKEIIEMEEKIKKAKNTEFSYILFFSKISLNIEQLDKKSYSIVESIENEIKQENITEKNDILQNLLSNYHLKYDLKTYKNQSTFIDDTKQCEINDSNTVGYCKCQDDECEILYQQNAKPDIKTEKSSNITFFDKKNNDLDKKKKKVYISFAFFVLTLSILVLVMVVKIKKNNLTNNA